MSAWLLAAQVIAVHFHAGLELEAGPQLVAQEASGLHGSCDRDGPCPYDAAEEDEFLSYQDESRLAWHLWLTTGLRAGGITAEAAATFTYGMWFAWRLRAGHDLGTGGTRLLFLEGGNEHWVAGRDSEGGALRFRGPTLGAGYRFSWRGESTHWYVTGGLRGMRATEWLSDLGIEQGAGHARRADVLVFGYVALGGALGGGGD